MLSVSALQGQYYGMRFSGIEVPPDQRSGILIMDEQAIKSKLGLDLQFFLRLEQDPDFEVRKKHKANYGYVFRMVFGDHNIDLVHQFEQDNPNNFQLISGDQSSRIAFSIPIEELWKNWLKLSLELDFVNQHLRLLVNDGIFTSELPDFDSSEGYSLMFGANSHGK